MIRRRARVFVPVVLLVAGVVAVLLQESGSRVATPPSAGAVSSVAEWQPAKDVPPELRHHPLPERTGHDGGTGSSRKREPYEPGPLAVVRTPGVAPADGGRSIVLRVDAIELLDGAPVVRSIPFDGRAAVRLEDVVAAVSDPGWISRDEAGVVLLQAALIQAEGTHLQISRPGVSEVRLAALPGVFLAGTGATARLEGVRVWSWKLDGSGPDPDSSYRRPFIVYQEGSRLDILSCEIAFLGSDRVSAYGVSWREGGTTGEVLDSHFHHNYFGVYTFEARDMVFRGNRLYDNASYGFDPHDYSTGLVVEDNEAWGNGSHGFIFSRGVTDGVVRRNYAHHNVGNGIMMDLGSDRNLIAANRVEHNAGDGIVLSASWDVVVADNLVRGNRVGIRSAGESLRNRFVGNRLVDNVTGIQLHGGTRDSLLERNVVRGSDQIGLLLDAPGSDVRGGLVDGGSRGLDVRAPASVTGLLVRRVDRGLVVRQGATLTGRGLTVDAQRTAIVAEPTAVVKVVESRLRALQSTEGAGVELGPGIDQGRRGAPWLAVAGIGFIAAAVTLEVIRGLRSRRSEPGLQASSLLTPSR